MEQLKLNSVKKTATRIDVSPATVRRMIRDGRLGFHRIGRSIRVSDSEIQRLLESGYRPAESQEFVGVSAR